MHGNDGPFAHPLDREWHGEDHVLATILNAGCENPEVPVSQFLHVLDFIGLLREGVFLARDRKMSGEPNILHRGFEAFMKFRLVRNRKAKGSDRE